MTLYHLAMAAHHSLPDDVRHPALAHLRAALGKPTVPYYKGIREALLATGEKEILDLVMAHPVQKINPDLTPDLSQYAWPHGIDIDVGRYWLHFYDATPQTLLSLLDNSQNLQGAEITASVALALMDSSESPSKKTQRRLASQRLTADWNGASNAGRIVDRFLAKHIKHDHWVDAYHKSPNMYALAALMMVCDTHIVARALATSSAHNALEIVAHLPDTAAWRGMTNRQAGASLRAHLAQFFPWALTRKERKALTRKKTRAGPHLANTPEAIAKRKARAAKRKRKEEAQSS